MHRGIALAAAAAAAVLGMFPVAPVAGAAATVPDDASAPDAVARDADAARELIDRGQIDLDAVLAREDFDPEAIVLFVHREIAFEPYAGVLRGARGTLLSRAGNAFDQAVLLATLLKDAGFDARIRRGRLSQDQARELLLRAGRPRVSSPEPGDMKGLRALLGPPEGSRAPASSTAWTQGERQVERAVEVLREALDAAGVTIGDPDAAGTLVEEARDYAWVEWRPGPAASWQPVHPAYEQGEGPDGVAPLETWAGEVPSDWQHRLRVGVFIEQKIGDQLRVHRVVPDWERPVANLTERSFVVANYPSGMPGDLSGLDPDAVLAQSEVFLPLFDGGVLPGSRGFDLDGVTYDLELGLDRTGATGVVRTVGGKAESAASALAGLGAGTSRTRPSDLRTLTAQWVDYTLIAPGGRETTSRRYLLDRLGPAARAKRDWNALTSPLDARQLVASHEFAVAASRVPEALVLDESMRLLGAVSRFAAAASREQGADLALPTGAPLENLRTALPFLELFHRFDRPLPAQGGAVEYRQEPTVVAFHHVLTAEGRARFNVDVVHHATRALKLASGTVAAVPAAVMRRGVWTTWVERSAAPLAGLAGCAASVHRDAFEAFQEVSAAGVGPIAIGPREVPDERSPGDVAGYVDRDLDGGYALVVQGPAPRAALPAWWRIDARSGGALGVLSNGTGGSLLEYQDIPERGIIWGLMVGAGVMTALSFPNMLECTQQLEAQRKHTGRQANIVCCIVAKNARSLNEVLLSRWAWANYTLRRVEAWGARDCR